MTQKIKVEKDNYVDPSDEGYDPDGKDGAILIDLCDENQNKWDTVHSEHCSKQQLIQKIISSTRYKLDIRVTVHVWTKV